MSAAETDNTIKPTDNRDGIVAGFCLRPKIHKETQPFMSHFTAYARSCPREIIYQIMDDISNPLLSL